MATITVIGTGLIGTSLGLALRQSKLQNLELVGTDIERASLRVAQKRGAFHRIENRFIPAIRDADMVILATPVMAMKELMEFIGPELPEGCVVTDVGSSKKIVLEWADQYLPKTVDFVGGHPMAGKEAAGPEAAEASLFQGKPYCIVPSPHARQRAASELTTMAEAIGARPFFIGLAEHDSFVAAVSHLPFLLSVALVGCTSKSVNWDDIAQLASTGYHDTSRLASGDPVMHRDICLSNTEPIVAWIDSFIRELYELRKLLDNGTALEGESIKKVFEQAFDARTLWLARQGNPQTHQHRSGPEIPSFTENMGEMFVGRKIMEAQKRFSGESRDGGRKRR